MVKVEGYCPMGCGRTLFLGSGGYVTCSWSRCPNPTAASDLLGIRETWHVAHLDERNYRLVHPLACRLGHADLACPEDAYLRALSGPPRKPGRYWMHAHDDGTFDFVVED